MTSLENMLAKYFSGELPPDEAAELLACCRSNPAARAELASITRTHRALRWMHHDRDAARFQSEVMVRIEPDGVESAAFVAGVIAKVHPESHLRPGSAPSWFWQKVTAAAAAIALTAGAAFFLNSLRLRDDARTIQAASDPHVAVVTSLTGDDTGTLAVGRALSAGELSIKGGRVGLSFAGGAQLVIDGPASLALLSPSRARLISGKAAAHVPEGARGFTVETPGVEVVDLGTEFGVSVSEAGVSDVHVFQGEVEARIGGDDTQPGSLVALNTAEGRRFARDGMAETTRPDPASFPPPPSPSPDAPVTQGAIHFLHQPPVSVETGHLESNEFILLFKEREAVNLTHGTLVSFARPGRYSGTQKLRAKIEPSRHVSSYLLHYDPTTRSTDRTPLRREGSVTFGKPIVGVINKQAALNQTDHMLGHPGAVYDRDKRRGVERNTTDASSDVIVLSRDRRTLHFNLAVSGDLDQVRILVRADEHNAGVDPVSEPPAPTVKP